MEKVLIVAPHPDDETLGAGGALLAHRAAGDRLHWLIATTMGPAYADAARRKREKEIATVAQRYRFASVHRLSHATGTLSDAHLGALVSEIGSTVRQVGATVLYLPFENDAHSDHNVVFRAGAACSKWFRYPTIRRVLSYEVLSETDASLRAGRFTPNVYVDISAHLDAKLKILKVFASEVGTHPYPRSAGALRALAQLRGAESGYSAAEAFLLLRQR